MDWETEKKTGTLINALVFVGSTIWTYGLSRSIAVCGTI